jgi:predicted Zn-dependent peptidase
MIETTRFTLDNGLRVVHNRDASTAMVAINILYNVGARDEDPQMTGLAHLFEHLMFGGSANIPDFDSELQRAGGVSNAWTSNDFTNFYDVVPAQNVETALWLESDRMLALSFDQRSLDIQRSVVIEEFKQQCLNRPFGDMSHYLRRLVYTVHPYRFPVIGKEIADLEKVTIDDIRRFFYSHYAPNNAVLAISGNITADNARRLIEKWFGNIPGRDIAPRLYPREPLQTSPRQASATGRVSCTALTLAYPMKAYGSRQYFGADLLTDLLANGPASRFYRRLLIGTDIFSEIDASILGCEEPGMLMVNAKLIDGSDKGIKRALDAIDHEIDDICQNPIEQRQLTRAVNRMESAATFANISYLNKAQALALCEMHGEDINRAMEPYRKLTPDDIRSTARQIFDPSRRSTLIYSPCQDN